MKKPIAIQLTDIHLCEDNIQLTKDLMEQAIRIAGDNNVSTIYIGGDIFQARRAQSEKVLNAWLDILDITHNYGYQIRAIPGNHDKIDYFGQSSYLDVYRHHPGFDLTCDYKCYDDHDAIAIHMIPFFDEQQVYNRYLNQVQLRDNKLNHLITHIATEKVRNNDGNYIQQGEGVDIQGLKKFDKVYVGHYHDRQVIDDFIHYIGAVKQKDYGERQAKGFVVMYDDGSHQFVDSKFKKYTTITIDIDQLQHQQILDKVSTYDTNNMYVRLKFVGDKSRVSAIDKNVFADLGFDVKFKYKDQNIDLSYDEATNITKLDDKKIVKEWSTFAKDNKIAVTTGTKYLKQIL